MITVIELVDVLLVDRGQETRVNTFARVVVHRLCTMRILKVLSVCIAALRFEGARRPVNRFT